MLPKGNIAGQTTLRICPENAAIRAGGFWREPKIACNFSSVRGYHRKHIRWGEKPPTAGDMRTIVLGWLAIRIRIGDLARRAALATRAVPNAL
jgi:hypothetical protein